MAKAQSTSKSEWNKRYRATPQGAAACAWNRLTSRAGAKFGHRQCYAAVEVRMSRADFMAWAIPAYEAWFRDRPGETPSVDRIESTGHYELGNLRLIEVQKNRRLSKRFVNDAAPEGTKWCSGCRQFVSHENFSRGKPDLHRPDGLGLRCRACQTAYNQKYVKRRKAEGRPIIDKRRKKRSPTAEPPSAPLPSDEGHEPDATLFP